MKRKFQALLNSYGGKSGFLRHILAKIAYFFGIYSRYENVDYSRVKRLVFVCKGNICRSPYGEFRARKLGLFAASAGLHAGDGAKANKDASRISETRSLSLATHEAKSIGALHFESTDLIIAFEPWQAHELDRFRYENGAQVTLLGLHLKNKMPHIHDPYMLSDTYFQKCFERIDLALEEIKSHLNEYSRS